MDVKVKYLVNDIPRLEYVEGKSDWIDLCAAEDVILKKGEFQLIPLGIAMEIPKGYEAHLIPRSSTFGKYGIIQANSMGLLDESYCGNNDQWFFPAYPTRDVTIAKGTRLCQFRLMEHQPALEFVEVEDLGNTDRGGFGSTGN